MECIYFCETDENKKYIYFYGTEKILIKVTVRNPTMTTTMWKCHLLRWLLVHTGYKTAFLRNKMKLIRDLPLHYSFDSDIGAFNLDDKFVF